MFQYLVIIGAAVELLGNIIYIRGTWRGEIKPNKVSFLLWSVIPMIATAAGLSAGVGWAILPVFMAGFVCFLIFLVSFYNSDAYWKLRPLDYVCGILSALAIIIWAYTKEPNIAIGLSILADFLAGIPTLIKSWKFPWTESGVAYLASLFNALTAFFAIRIWNFSELAFPIFLIVMNLTFSIFIFRKRIYPYFYKEKTI